MLPLLLRSRGVRCTNRGASSAARKLHDGAGANAALSTGGGYGLTMQLTLATLQGRHESHHAACKMGRKLTSPQGQPLGQHAVCIRSTASGVQMLLVTCARQLCETSCSRLPTSSAGHCNSDAFGVSETDSRRIEKASLLYGESDAEAPAIVMLFG